MGLGHLLSLLCLACFAIVGASISATINRPTSRLSFNDSVWHLPSSEPRCPPSRSSSWLHELDSGLTQKLSQGLLNYGKSHKAHVMRIAKTEYYFAKIKHPIFRHFYPSSSLNLSLHPFLSNKFDPTEDYYGDIFATLYKNTRYAFLLPEFRINRFLDKHNSTLVHSCFRVY